MDRAILENLAIKGAEELSQYLKCLNSLISKTYFGGVAVEYEGSDVEVESLRKVLTDFDKTMDFKSLRDYVNFFLRNTHDHALVNPLVPISPHVYRQPDSRRCETASMKINAREVREKHAVLSELWELLDDPRRIHLSGSTVYDVQLPGADLDLVVCQHGGDFYQSDEQMAVAAKEVQNAFSRKTFKFPSIFYVGPQMKTPVVHAKHNGIYVDVSFGPNAVYLSKLLAEYTSYNWVKEVIVVVKYLLKKADLLGSRTKGMSSVGEVVMVLSFMVRNKLIDPIVWDETGYKAGRVQEAPDTTLNIVQMFFHDLASFSFIHHAFDLRGVVAAKRNCPGFIQINDPYGKGNLADRSTQNLAYLIQGYARVLARSDVGNAIISRN